MKSILTLALMATLAAPNVVMAHGKLKSVGPSSIETQRQVCAADFSKFCPGQAMGGGRMGRCLINFTSSISNDCADIVHHWCPTGRCP